MGLQEEVASWEEERRRLTVERNRWVVGAAAGLQVCHILVHWHSNCGCYLLAHWVAVLCCQFFKAFLFTHAPVLVCVLQACPRH